MTTYLLDANVLIALAFPEHEHHDIAARWYRGVKSVALCPMTEGALARYVVSLGEIGESASLLIAQYKALPNFEFWPDALSYADVEMRHVRGRNQVTDAYLLSLIKQHPQSLLATFDKSLAAIDPQRTCLLIS